MRDNLTPPNVRRYLDLSTAHLTKGTVGNPPFLVARYEYGVLLYVPDEVGDGCPEDLAKVVKYAKKHDCSMILFDSDAPTLGALPTYPW